MQLRCDGKRYSRPARSIDNILVTPQLYASSICKIDDIVSVYVNITILTKVLILSNTLIDYTIIHAEALDDQHISYEFLLTSVARGVML